MSEFSRRSPGTRTCW